jgi:hypothetical protein
LHAIFTQTYRTHREVIGEVKEEFCRLFGQSPLMDLQVSMQVPLLTQ